MSDIPKSSGAARRRYERRQPKNHAKVLAAAVDKLEAGDAGGYWREIGKISKMYGTLAGQVSRDEMHGKGARERVQDAFEVRSGRRLTEKELDEIELEIAQADHDVRADSLERTGRADVSLKDTVDYHKTVFSRRDIPAEAYTLTNLTRAIGPAAEKMRDTDTDFPDRFVLESVKNPSASLDTLGEYLIDSADAVGHSLSPDDNEDSAREETDDEPDKTDDKPDDQSALPPEAEKLRAVFRLSDEDEAGAVGLMRKDIADLTQDEVDAMHGFAFDERDRDTRHALQDRLRDFYQLTYGEGKVETDEIGRMVQPTAARAVPETTLAAKTATGEWLKPALKRVADTLARRAKEDGAAKTVTDVQSGLSALGAALKPDGIAGPRTRTAVIDAVAKAGPGKIDEAWALGAFKSFADQAKAKPATMGSLAQTLKKNVDPLFKLPSSQKPKAPVPVQVDVMPERIKPAPSIEASATTRALQRGLNDLKPDTSVKEDGVLGPKTTHAFNRALRDEGSDGVTQSFASTLGFS